MERHYGWVIVAVGALMGCIGMGSMFSLAVFLDPIATGTGWSRAGISASMTVAFLAMGFGAFFWGWVSDRHGPRIVGIAGGLLLGTGLVLASQAQSLAAFQLAYGLFLGAAVGAFFAPIMATASAWFDRHRALAVSLVSAGLGMAPVTVAPFAQWLLTGHDWRTAQLVIGLVAWVILLPAALLLRRPPVLAATAAAAPPGESLTARQALGSRQFIALAATFFACCLAHAGPIFHVVSYAMVCGLSALAAVSVYSLQGLAGLGGRLLLGVLADRYGAKPVLIGGLMLQALAIGAFLPARSLGEFYAVAALFGLAYGGVMPLYAVLARDYFGPRIMGTVFGAATMISCLGMAVGPAIGGWIFDRFGSYAGMHLASLAVGLGAVAVAFTFPPLPGMRPERFRPA
ncbi:MFS transporter [Siccirubricoccus sp. KC 17139]|uniref:MFS transporter n=1 Tax=Siccirubricoccus soli TaxID=2899147 RepID=A0ABT1D661_9PROT|nr:MFS transporter [Siccirubricoccus soli]MCO6417412.1 MFS transporter [Siccirubricoccus soli]MCP2683547.1 MFS transporter [Siccirubricoccus soli]